METDSERGQRIKLVRLRKGKRSQKEFGELFGLSHGQVGNWERGGRVTADRMLEIAAVEEISFEWLKDGLGQMTSTPAAATPDQADREATKSLPLFAAQEIAGGLMIVSTHELERVKYPVNSSMRATGYGIYVVGDTMSPAFRPGDAILIDRSLPPIRDVDVVLYCRGENGQEQAMIRTLVDYTETKWVVERLKPEPRREDFQRSVWTKCHRIVVKIARR